MSDPSQPVGRVVPIKALIPLLVLTAVVSIAGALALDRLALTEPADDRPAVEAEQSVDAEEVWSVIESDSQRLGLALAPTPFDLRDGVDELEGTVEDVTATADDAASAAEEARSSVEDLASTVDELSGKLGEVCGELSFAEALSDVLLDCP